MAEVSGTIGSVPAATTTSAPNVQSTSTSGIKQGATTTTSTKTNTHSHTGTSTCYILLNERDNVLNIDTFFIIFIYPESHAFKTCN